MEKVMKEYEEFLLIQELAKGTRSTYLREAKRFMIYVGERSITKKVTLDYKAMKNDSNLKAVTINLHLVAVNKFLKFLGKPECCIKLNRIQKARSVKNVITKKEYKCLCEYALESGRLKYYYIMRTLAGTGIRISELKFFTVESINKGIITVRNKGKNREIFVPDEMVKELNEYCIKENIRSGAIFLGDKNKPISRNAVFKMLKHLADMTGISEDKVYPHSFRHLFALTYMEKYHNLSELADILGHSSMETTRIYLSVSAEQKQAKIGALGLL